MKKSKINKKQNPTVYSYRVGSNVEKIENLVSDYIIYDDQKISIEDLKSLKGAFKKEINLVTYVNKYNEDKKEFDIRLTTLENLVGESDGKSNSLIGRISALEGYVNQVYSTELNQFYTELNDEVMGLIVNVEDINNQVSKLVDLPTELLKLDLWYKTLESSNTTHSEQIKSITEDLSTLKQLNLTKVKEDVNKLNEIDHSKFAKLTDLSNLSGLETKVNKLSEIDHSEFVKRTELQTKITELETKNQSLAQEINSLKAAIEELKKQISSGSSGTITDENITQEMETMKSQIKDMTNRTKTWYDGVMIYTVMIGTPDNFSYEYYGLDIQSIIQKLNPDAAVKIGEKWYINNCTSEEFQGDWSKVDDQDGLQIAIGNGNAL